MEQACQVPHLAADGVLMFPACVQHVQLLKTPLFRCDCKDWPLPHGKRRRQCRLLITARFLRSGQRAERPAIGRHCFLNKLLYRSSTREDLFGMMFDQSQTLTTFWKTKIKKKKNTTNSNPIKAARCFKSQKGLIVSVPHSNRTCSVIQGWACADNYFAVFFWGRHLAQVREVQWNIVPRRSSGELEMSRNPMFFNGMYMSWHTAESGTLLACGDKEQAPLWKKRKKDSLCFFF